MAKSLPPKGGGYGEVGHKKMNKQTIRQAALRTLEIEAETLTALRGSIDEVFCRAVDAIHSGAGRVIVTGIGKSAIVAQKIVATLNSTGTPSIYMHAADAIHGDLGMILPEDVLLCLSKSGGTAEIKVLLPLVKHLGNLIIGMTARRESYLAEHADHLLFTPIKREADPNDLAPTASTTAQMALGDALAMSLLSLRGFRPKDFAQFHPGGVLGKQFYLRVAGLCSQNECPAVSPKTSVHDAILEITTKRLGCTAVVSASGKILGIITDGDLRRMLEKHPGEVFSKLTAGEVMGHSPKTIEANELAVSALEILRENSITQLLVTEAGEYVGVVHLHDLIREGLV